MPRGLQQVVDHLWSARQAAVQFAGAMGAGSHGIFIISWWMNNDEHHFFGGVMLMNVDEL